MGSVQHATFAFQGALNKRLPSHYSHSQNVSKWVSNYTLGLGQYDPQSPIYIAVIIGLEAYSDIGRVAESTGKRYSFSVFIGAF